MKIQEAVKTETKKIAVGVTGLTALMLLVFLVLGRLDHTVFLGAVLGACAAVGNFFLMAYAVQRAAEKMNGVHAAADAEEADPDSEEEKLLAERKQQAKKCMQLSYYGRLLLTAALALLAVLVPIFHPLAALIPLLFPRIVIFLFQMLQGRKGEQN